MLIEEGGVVHVIVVQGVELVNVGTIEAVEASILLMVTGSVAEMIIVGTVLLLLPLLLLHLHLLHPLDGELVEPFDGRHFFLIILADSLFEQVHVARHRLLVLIWSTAHHASVPFPSFP